jgi:hypothetical protein
VLVVVETVLLALVTVLAVASAGIGFAARDQGGLGDVAALLSALAAVVSAGLVVLAVLTLRAVRRRARALQPLSAALHVLPVALLGSAATSGVPALQRLAVLWALVAVVGLAETYWPSTTRWLRSAGA